MCQICFLCEYILYGQEKFYAVTIMNKKVVSDTANIELIEISEAHFKNMFSIHDKDGGNQINTSLSKLFECMNNESNKYEVSIKVAALNQIYSTAIQYIAPVVDKIICEVPHNHHSCTDNKYADFVDGISTVNWVSPTTGKHHSRCNMSFSSKYIHFLSGRKIPIYDSYIWIVMIGYLKQNGFNEYKFTSPADYNDFYNVFIKFKNHFNLNKYSNYDIDKFLWQYGKIMLNEIVLVEKVSLDKAKVVLKKRITNNST